MRIGLGFGLVMCIRIWFVVLKMVMLLICRLVSEILGGLKMVLKVVQLVLFRSRVININREGMESLWVMGFFLVFIVEIGQDCKSYMRVCQVWGQSFGMKCQILLFLMMCFLYGVVKCVLRINVGVLVQCVRKLWCVCIVCFEFQLVLQCQFGLVYCDGWCMRLLVMIVFLFFEVMCIDM